MTWADQQLVEGLKLSRQIREMAQRGEWEEMPPLFEQRDHLLRDCFEHQDGFSDNEAATGVIQQILSIDQEMMKLNGQERERLMADMRGISKGRQAVNAYHGVGVLEV